MRKRFWSRPRAPARLRVAPAGPSSCSPARWCASPITAASRARPCAGAWPRTSSSRGARRCGACRRSMASTWPAWRMCLISTPSRPIRRARWSACDESPVQLIGEVREPIPAAPGRLERVDYEYRRNGTLNLFVAVDAHRSWRKVSVSERRTAQDYAERLRELVDVDYPEAACIRVVQDNLSTHTQGSLYETFPAAEAHRILGRLEFHYTPKHASWLNMVEIEIGVLKGQCLDRRIDNRAELEREIAAWERERNAAGARVNWMFTTEKARTKMGRAYPKPSAALDQPVNES